MKGVCVACFYVMVYSSNCRWKSIMCFILLKISTEDDRVLLAAQLDQEVAMVRTPGTMAPQRGNSSGRWMLYCTYIVYGLLE